MMTDTTESKTDAPAKAVQLRQTHQGRFKLGGHYTQDWEVCVEPGVTLEDVLKPEFFCHVAKQLRTFSKIKVMPDDASWYAELIVRAAGTTWAKCVLFHVVEFDAKPQAEASTPAEYARVSWGGPSQKHRVVRVSDGEVISKEHATPDDAAAWLKDHLKTIGR